MKKHLLGIAAAMAVAGLISLITARRIEAQFSSPVKIVNTTSAPAITQSVPELASQMIRLSSLASVSQNSLCGQDGDEDCPSMVQINSDGSYVNYPTPYTVPAGQKLVITTVSFTPNLNNTAGSATIDLRADSQLGGAFGLWQVDRTHSSEFHPTGVVVNSGHFLKTVVTMLPSAQMSIEVQGYLTAN